MEQFPRHVLVDWARNEPQIRALFVFGSRAMGRATASSNIDLAVELSVPEDEQLVTFLNNRQRWRADLQRVTGMRVKNLVLRGESTAASSGIEVYRR
jgi:predicted nucleotidyltransferase